MWRLRPPRAAQTQKQLLRTVRNYHVFLRSLTAVCGRISNLQPCCYYSASICAPKTVNLTKIKKRDCWIFHLLAKVLVTWLQFCREKPGSKNFWWPCKIEQKQEIEFIWSRDCVYNWKIVGKMPELASRDAYILARSVCCLDHVALLIAKKNVLRSTCSSCVQEQMLNNISRTATLTAFHYT